MQLHIKKKAISIPHLYIICMMLVSCWEILMPTSFLDEVLLILFWIYIILNNINPPKKIILVVVAFVMWAMLGLIFNLSVSSYSLFILIDTLKPILMLITFLCIKIDDDYYKKILDTFCIINIPSALLGIVNGLFYNYLGRDPLIESGSLKYIDGELVLRSGGLVFVSGVFSDICAVLFVSILFTYKWDIKKIILLGIFCLGVLFGRGRFPLLLMLCGVIWYLWINLSRKLRRVLIFLVVFLVLGAIIPTVKYITTEYAFDLENQVRFVPYALLFTIPESILTFGLGVGNIGSTNSFIYNPNLYTKYGLMGVSDLDWEAQFGKLLVQTGLIGTIIWFFPFVFGFVKAFKSKNQYKNICIYITGYYLINLLMNKSYEVQILILVCASISYITRKEKTYGKY